MLLSLIPHVRDLPLSEEQVRLLLGRLHRAALSLEIQELPVYVYQLTLFANKAHVATVVRLLLAVLEHSQQQTPQGDPSAQRQHAQVTGTVLLNFAMAARQNQLLGPSLTASLKGRRLALAPVATALVLALGDQRVKPRGMDVLRELALASLQGQHRHESSAWVRGLSARHRPLFPSMWELLMSALERSVAGWAAVTEGLVELAFALLDVPTEEGKLKTSSSSSSSSSSSPSSSSSSTASAAARPLLTSCFSGDLGSERSHDGLSPAVSAVRLGSAVLLRVFDAHETSRAHILEQLLSRVVTESCNAGLPAAALLGKLIEQHSAALLVRGDE